MYSTYTLIGILYKHPINLNRKIIHNYYFFNLYRYHVFKLRLSYNYLYITIYVLIKKYIEKNVFPVTKNVIRTIEGFYHSYTAIKYNV